MSTRKQGKYLFGLMHTNADLILDAYGSPSLEFDETEDNARKIQSLVNGRIAWNPDIDIDPTSQARLSRPIREFLDYALKTERLRHINNDVGVRMQGIEEQTIHYLRLRQIATYDDASVALEAVKEQVYELKDILIESTRRLWQRTSNDFAHVSSLAAKIEENQQAINQAEGLIATLRALDSFTLAETVGSDRTLLSLFQLVIPQAKDKCLQDLIDMMHRMKASLFSFRNLEKRDRLTSALAQQFEARPGYAFLGLREKHPIPRVFNRREASPISTHIDTRNVHNETLLTTTLNGLRRDPVEDEKITAEPVSVDQTVAAPVRLETPKIIKSAEAMIIQVVHNKTALSASETLHMAPGHTLEEWIYTLLNEYHGRKNLQRFIHLDWEGEPMKNSPGNFFARDVVLCHRSTLGQ